MPHEEAALHAVIDSMMLSALNYIYLITCNISLKFGISWQMDKNMDGTGDVCDTSSDLDNDGVQDGWMGQL